MLIFFALCFIAGLLISVVVFAHQILAVLEQIRDRLPEAPKEEPSAG